jgi:hypothetical protein
MTEKRYLAERWYVNASHDKDVDLQEFDILADAIAWLAKLSSCPGEYDRCVLDTTDSLARVWPEPRDSVRATASETLRMSDRQLTGASAALFDCFRPANPSEQLANLQQLDSVVVQCGTGACQHITFPAKAPS